MQRIEDFPPEVTQSNMSLMIISCFIGSYPVSDSQRASIFLARTLVLPRIGDSVVYPQVDMTWRLFFTVARLAAHYHNDYNIVIDY